jgi:hypothetical protein
MYVHTLTHIHTHTGPHLTWKDILDARAAVVVRGVYIGYREWGEEDKTGGDVDTL